jgi:VWFA-related protein
MMWRTFRFFLSFSIGTALCTAQTPAASTPRAPDAPEISTQDESFTFKSKVTLIQVPVVVRDQSGKTVGTLRREDFQLFDKGKPQVISQFSVEKSGGKAIARLASPEAELTPEEKAAHAEAPLVIAPDHFVALVFDDVHAELADLANPRAAAQKFIASRLTPKDRVAIFTTSGQTTLDFTADRDLLNKTLLQLAPHPMDPPPDCLPMTYVEAYRITDMADPAMLHKKTLEAFLNNCSSQTGGLSPSEAVALSRAGTVMDFARYNVRHTFTALSAMIRRMAQMPGQRTLILASPGFVRPLSQLPEEGKMIDLAIRSGVIINTLDARGLYTAASKAETNDPSVDRISPMAQSGVLENLATGTGGKFIENTNALAKGFEELGTAPEVYYLLGFSPQEVKLDGAFHSLKVKVKATPGLSIQARRGYYAPAHLSSADEDAKEAVAQALFSRDEIRNIPLEMNARFLKTSESEAKLTVLARVGVGKLHFRKADGRNVNDVLVVCGLFDRNGNYLQGVTKTVQMRLLDDTLRNKLNEGLSIRSDFNVAPGTYLIRVVVRDAEGQTMTAQNGAVEIP